MMGLPEEQGPHERGQQPLGTQEWGTARRSLVNKIEPVGLTVRLVGTENLGRAGHTALLTIEGEAEVDSAEVLRDALDHAFGLPNIRNVVLDMTGLGFLDSIALVALIDTQNRARSEARCFVLAGTGPQPWRVFQVTRTAPLFTFAASVDSARTFLSGETGGRRE